MFVFSVVAVGDKFVFMDDNATCHRTLAVQDCLRQRGTATAGSDVVQSGRPIFDDFFPTFVAVLSGNNTANVVFQMVKRLWLIRIDQ
ncbi:hypothetical protein TNCV_21171 [Trichonephila clavipes]|nr:hypothetical protein TNCV_21171 [Trichonephila clavipes]